MDGLLAGSFKGRSVIVLVVVKYDMGAWWKQAQAEFMSAKLHRQMLAASHRTKKAAHNPFSKR